MLSIDLTFLTTISLYFLLIKKTSQDAEKYNFAYSGLVRRGGYIFTITAELKKTKNENVIIIFILKLVRLKFKS